MVSYASITLQLLETSLDTLFYTHTKEDRREQKKDLWFSFGGALFPTSSYIFEGIVPGSKKYTILVSIVHIQKEICLNIEN